MTTMPSLGGVAGPVPRAAIEAQLERVLGSARLRNAPALTRLLRYLVERSTSGAADQVKEYTVGVDVFDRGATFDPKIDTIVRVQARRLRHRLDEYYQAEGRRDPVRITLPKGHYVAAFVWSPDQVPSNGTAPPTAPALEAVSRVAVPSARRAGRTTGWLALSIVLVTASGAWLSRARPVVDANAAAPFQDLSRVTFDPGLQRDVAWSPDGRAIAYASDKAGNLDIWVQPIAGGEAVRLTRSPAPDTWPAWSPDGSRLVFRSEMDGGGLYVIPVQGGSPRRIASEGCIAWWSADGREITFRTDPADMPSSPVSLRAVAVDGTGPPRDVLAGFLGGGWWNWIAPHPDGRVSALGEHRTYGYAFFSVELDGSNLHIDSVPRGAAAALGLDELHPFARFHWAPRGDAVYFEVEPREVPSIWRVPVVDGVLKWREVARLTTGAGGAMSAAISPDGNHLAFTAGRRSSRAWVFPFDAREGRITGEGRPVTPEDVRAINLRLTLDGRSLLYGAPRRGRGRVDVHVMDVDTGTDRILVHNAWSAVQSDDGTKVGYMVRRAPSSSNHIRAFDEGVEVASAIRGHDGQERLLKPFSEVGWFGPFDWASDDRTMLGIYWKRPPDGPVSLALWRAADPPSLQPDAVLLEEPEWQFWQPLFSPDHRWISFVAIALDPPRGQIGVIPATGRSTEWAHVAVNHDWPDKPRWSPDGRMLYFLSRKPAGFFNVWGVRIDPNRGTAVGTPFRVTQFDSTSLTIDPDVGSAEMDVAGDRLALTIRAATGNIWMLSVARR